MRSQFLQFGQVNHAAGVLPAAADSSEPGKEAMNMVSVPSDARRIGARRAMGRHLVLCLAILPLYFFLTLPQVALVSSLGTTVWYPAVGLAMALMVGVNPWYGILVCLCDVLVGSVVYRQPLASWSETLGAIGLAGCYGTAAWILRGPLKIDLRLSHRRDVVRYVFVTLAAATGATLIGVTCLALEHTILWNIFGGAALKWFLGDAVAILGIAPFFLLHVFPRVRDWLAPRLGKQNDKETFPISASYHDVAEHIGQAAAIAAVLWFTCNVTIPRFSHLYLCFIPIIWIAIRRGVRRAVIGVFVLNFGIALAMRMFPLPAGENAHVGLFMLVISATGLIVGSEVSERERIATDLQKQTDYLNGLIQNSPMGIIVLDNQGRVELANSAFEKLCLYDQNELKSSDLDALLSSSTGSHQKELGIIPRVFDGEALRVTVPWRRKDGKTIQVKINAVPLIVHGTVQGAYEICQDVSEYVDAREAREKYAASLKQMVEKMERHTAEMTWLNEVRDWLECCETEGEISVVVGKSIPRLFPDCLSGTLYLFRSTRELAETATYGAKGRSSEPVFAPGDCWALRRGHAHISDSGCSGVTCSHLRASSATSLCAPMIAQGSIQGILHIEFPSDTTSECQPVTESTLESQRRLAIAMAGHVATSLIGLRLRESLREQSVRDSLTGLFNRRFLEESLETELHRSKRNGTQVSVLMLDLDHFKQFNDTFGHDAGDHVLRSVANVFRGFFRGGDICCRFGGEEFAIILPDSSSQCATVRANALRTELKRMNLHYKGQPLGTVTASIGAATFPEHGKNSAEVLSAADQSLYESKARGRDRVTARSSNVATINSGSQSRSQSAV